MSAKQPIPSFDMLDPNRLRIPADDAKPTAVREYLTNVLHFSYNVPAKHAEELVSGWRYGRGHALNEYDVATFRQIFGAEVGALLYYHVNNKPTVSKRATGPISGNETTEAKKDLFGLPPGVSFMYLFLIMCIIPGLVACIQLLKGSTDDVDKMLKISGFFLLGFMYLYITFYYL
ncbi:hypothetical protein HDV62DRAFT_363315 [Trichoderma sp. SZMC 28011]